MAKKVEWVLKQGTFEKKRFGSNQPGLDLTRVIHDTLKDDSILVTDDCCKYWPSIPPLTVVDVDAPTESEMTNVPLLGLFRATDGTDTAIHIKLTASTTLEIATTVVP